MNVLDGAVIGHNMQHHRHQEFIRFLNAVERAVPAGKTIHAILDNRAAHKHPAVRLLARHLAMNLPLHADLSFLAQRGRGVLCHPDEASPQAWRLPFSRRSPGRHLLREAEKQIDMVAYVLTESAVIEALRDASARGEKVRVWRDASGAACCSKRRRSPRAIRSLVSVLVERKDNSSMQSSRIEFAGGSRGFAMSRNEANGSVLDHVAQRRSALPLGGRDCSTSCMTRPGTAHPPAAGARGSPSCTILPFCRTM